MAVEELVVDETLESMLGMVGLYEVAAQLWTEHCQTCGLPLGSEPPTLCVDVLDDETKASLHHQRCRLPGWNFWPPSVTPKYAKVTHMWVPMLFPARIKGQDLRIPALIINPSLEQVRLRQDTTGRWRVEFPSEFVRAGLRTVGSAGSIAIWCPVAGAGIQFQGSAISLILGSYPDPRFEPEMNDDQLTAIRRLDGLLLVVSQVLHPGLLQNWAQVVWALESEHAIVGWVGVRSESAEARGRTLAVITSAMPKNLDSQSSNSSEPAYVLYLNPRKGTIGGLLGQAKHHLSRGASFAVGRIRTK